MENIYGATFRPCDVHKYLLRGLSFITNCRKGGGRQGLGDNVAGRLLWENLKDGFNFIWNGACKVG